MSIRARHTSSVGAVLALLIGLLSALTGSPAVADQSDSARYRVAAASIVAGDSHTCALLVSGAVRCWGYNGEGQLGYGNTDSVGDGETPASIGNVPIGAAATALAAGAAHTCALLRSGAVRCWGNGVYGQLGYNSTENVGGGGATKSVKQAGNVPIGARAVAISAGATHTCALLTTGRVRCWGNGVSGQLGYNSTDNMGGGGATKSVKQAGNVPIGAIAIAISAGASHTCALLTTGHVRCWGAPGDGQLGYGDDDYVGTGLVGSKTIQQAGNVPVGARATALSSGDSHNCVVLGSGSLRCWGEGSSGQLGHNSQSDVGKGGTPTIMQAGNVPLGAKAAAVHGAAFHTCAVLASRALRCWGDNVHGQLGHDHKQNIGDGSGPTILASGVVAVGARVVAVAGGASHTCALLASGRVRCWGRGSEGRLGYSNADPVGDGTGKTIQQAGNVPVGAKVRVKAATNLSLNRRPRRDRTSPYVYRVNGRVNGRFAKDAATCGGKVTIKAFRGKRRLTTVRAGVNNSCRYSKRVKFWRGRLGTRNRVKIRIVAVFPGTTNLARDKAVRTAIAN